MKLKSESEVAQSWLTQRPHGLQSTRLFRPWDFPGKSTGVGCHCLLHTEAEAPILWPPDAKKMTQWTIPQEKLRAEGEGGDRG